MLWRRGKVTPHSLQVPLDGDRPFGQYLAVEAHDSPKESRTASYARSMTGPDPIISVELRFGMEEQGAEAWLDKVSFSDDLMWIAQGGEADPVTIHPEGQLLVGGEPFPVLGVQDRYEWLEKTAPLDSLRDRCLALGSKGAEFNTLLKPPSGLNMYATKREAYLILDAAQTAGMKAILWLPLYPPIAEEHKQIGLPLVSGLVEEWIEEFDDHPALLGWTYGDEKPEGQIRTAIDHNVFTNYEKSIFDLEANFRPIFLFTGDGPFEDGSGMGCWGNAAGRLSRQDARYRPCPNAELLSATSLAQRTRRCDPHALAVVLEQGDSPLRIRASVSAARRRRDHHNPRRIADHAVASPRSIAPGCGTAPRSSDAGRCRSISPAPETSPSPPMVMAGRRSATAPAPSSSHTAPAWARASPRRGTAG